jgi:hypothetical protein
MTFTGFDRAALNELRKLPRLDAAAYALRRDLLHAGLIEPARTLLDEVVAELDAPLTTSARGSVSPLHTDLRFAPPGAPRYKDHLLLTAWHGADKKAAPTLWIRIDTDSVGFASGLAFTPAVRTQWRASIAAAPGAQLAGHLQDLGSRHARHELEIAGDELQKVPSPWSREHPRADLLRKTGFQVRFRLSLGREVTTAALVRRCASAWNELLPTHRWLVKHLYERSTR